MRCSFRQGGASFFSLSGAGSVIGNTVKNQNYFTLAAAVLLLGFGSALQAQLVADGATNSLSTITNTFTGSVTVGTNGSFTLLVLGNNALLTNSTEGTIGMNPSARSNAVQLLGSGARWLMGGSLFVGFNSGGNQLVVSNISLVRDAVVRNSSGYLGANSGGSNRAAIMGSGTEWNNSGDLFVGVFGSGNRLTVSGGGLVRNNNGFVGVNTTSSNNLALVTDFGSTWTNALEFYVGYFASRNQVVVSNGATVFVAGAGFIGFKTNANANSIVATGPGARFLLATNFYIGTNGAFNTLVVSNGALVANKLGSLGHAISASNNLAVVTGSGSVWSNALELHIGNSSVNNQLVVSNGGTVAATGGASIGLNTSANGNSATVSDGGTWRLGGNFAIGASGSLNRLIITNGGQVFNSANGIIGFNNGGRSNVALVTGVGSIWTNGGSVFVGYSGAGNRMVVSNGAVVRAGSSGFVGLASTNNLAVVTGSGSVWSSIGTLTIGHFNGDNQLLVTNSGEVLAFGGAIVGNDTNAPKNRVVVDGGFLRLTNAFGTSILDVRHGTNVLKSGLAEVDRLFLTNAPGFFEFNGGMLTLRATTNNNGRTFTIGNGTNAATLQLLGGTNFFANNLVVASNASLIGNGTITGNLTNQAGGTLSPGTSIGKFTVNGALNLLAGSTNIFEINKAPLTNDSLVVTGAVAYGGTLIVTNLGGTLTNGDNFKLFTGASYSGTFSALVLPSLSPGLYWTNKLLIDGSIGIYLVPPRDFGVDVSHFQGETGVSQAGWNQMFTEGKRFAFIKATEGLSVLDAAMENNAARATAAGLRAGVYHFAHPELRPTTNGAIQEADYFMTYAGNLIGPGYLRPVLDLETGFGLTTAELTDWVIAFANEIVTHRGPGAAPIVYCSQSYANNELDSRLATYDLWLRTITAIDVSTNEPPIVSFPDPTGVFDNWSFWQYSDTGNSGGITPLDLNVCHSEFKLLDSFLIPAVASPVAPSIVTEPQDRTVVVSNNASFTVTVSVGTSTPFSYQWRFNGTNIAGATASAFTRTNAQFADAGDYTVVITNVAGSITSAVATLTVNAPTPPFEGVVLYSEDFDGYSSPSVVTSAGDTNGFKVFFNAVSGPVDFTALFGFDYSTVVSPTNIPVAPSTTNGTTKGLSLTVNKDGTAAIAAVNLYPLSQTFTGSYALKFDLWINHANNGTATEHTLFGINHSGAITNRVGLTNSDGLFFAMDGDGGVSSGSTTLRDFAVFRGGGTNAIPFLLVTNTLAFGPEPLLGALFDNADAGISALFPPQAIPGSTTAAGSAGLRWLSVEVRQLTNQITWLLDGVVIAQYTNNFDFTNGNILIGYNDAFASLGSAANFALFDNLRVETAVPDYDNDGLLDQWEVQFFGSLSANPALDSDGDGVSNLNELFAGTNPTNSASRFQLLSATRTNNDFLLTWSAVGGHSYVLQSQSSSAGGLATNFTDLSPLISVGGTSETLTNYVHVNGATNSGGYYRVRLGP